MGGVVYDKEIGEFAYMEEGVGPYLTTSMVMLTGKGNHHFEFRGGVLVGGEFSFNTIYKSFYSPIINLGYRYQKPDGGRFLKLKVGYLDLGFGVGYAF